MQAFPMNFMNNMFEQMKSQDMSSYFKHWKESMKMFEGNNFFTQFQNKADHNEALLKSYENINNLFSSGMRNLEALTEASQKIMANNQEVAKKRATSYQKSYADTMNLLKGLMATKSTECAVAKHTEFATKSFEKLVGDFKDLTESVSESNSKVFENLHTKLNSNLAKQAKDLKAATAK